MNGKLRNLFKSSSVYTVGNFLKRSLFLVSMPVLTRCLSTAEYGKLSLINTIIGILSTLFGLALGGYAMRSYYDCDNDYDKKKMLGTLFVFLLIFTLIISILLTFTGRYYYSSIFENIPFAPYFPLGVWICFFTAIETLPFAILRLKENALKYITIILSRSALMILLSILSVVILNMGAEGPLYASLVVNVLFACIYCLYLKGQIKLAYSNSVVKDGLIFSIPILAMLMGRNLFDSADRIFLQYYTNMSIVGIYSVGITIGSVLVMIANSINTAWVPFFYKLVKEDIDAKTIFSQASSFIYAIILFVGMIPIVFRHDIIFILAPSDYYVIIDILPYIMIGAILNSLFFIPVRGIYQGKKTIHLIYIVSSGLIVNIVANYYLIPKYEMLGASISTIGGSTVMLILCYLVSQRLFQIDYQWNKIAKTSLIFILCVFISCYAELSQLTLFNILQKLCLLFLFILLHFTANIFEQKKIIGFKKANKFW